MTASRQAREQFIRQVCEDYPGPFTSSDIFESLQDEARRERIRKPFTIQEVESALLRADYLVYVGIRNGRRLYLCRRRRRIPDDPIGFARGPRKCGRCGREIEPGEVMLNLSNEVGRRCRGMCRECATKALLEWWEQLQD